MPYQHFLLLFFWIVIATLLRFTNLGALPPWTDESATVVFSLGNSFYNVGLDQFIGLETLLEPLQVSSATGISDVIDRLLSESTHPPVYFVLTHLWLKLFFPEAGLASIWGARSLSALLGIISILAIFGFTRFAFRSLIVAQIAAAMMAISPFGIFLALQARHYTLTILLIIASLYCFIYAFRSIYRGKIIPLWLVWLWIGINCLGIATHYFFVLTLAAIAISFIPLMWRQFRQDKTVLLSPQWRRIYLVALGSLVGCLVWLPILPTIQDSPPTDWVYESNPTKKWLDPIGRFLLWIMSMAILLPSSLYDLSSAIVIVSGILTLIFWIWSLPHLARGLKLQQQNQDGKEAIAALRTYLLSMIAIFFGFTYILGMDLTLAGRFNFVYFPVVISLIAAGLSPFWHQKNSTISQPNSSKYSWLNSIKNPGRKTVIIFISVSLLGGIISNMNLGYLQNHRPDLMVNAIAEGSQAPIAIATTYRHHGQTGRMIGLAWKLKDLPNISNPIFFLATPDPEDNSYNHSVQKLNQELAKIERPLDLWLVNFRAEIDLETQNCFLDPEYRGSLGQHNYKLYRCRD